MTSTNGSLEALDGALQLAERAGDGQGAEELRRRIRAAEEASPWKALMWQQQRQINKATDTVFLGRDEPLEVRLKALRSLRSQAVPPFAAPGAEEALHRILAEISGPDATALREAAEEALWKCYRASGDKQVDDMMKRGSVLLHSGDFETAVAIFTEVVELAPEYAEGWNKRAAAYYMKEDFARCLEDCDRALSLKPLHFGCLSSRGKCLVSLQERDRAAETFKRALAVHPGMGSALRALDRLERKDNFEAILYPRAEQVTSALRGVSPTPDEWYPWDLDGADNGLATSWDVHQLATEAGAGPLVYLLRVSIRSEGLGTVPVRSLGRFYALRFESGLMLQLKRPTEGEVEFWLEPGEEYRYCWVFAADQASPLAAMQGGMLLERPSKAGGAAAERFLAVNLDFLSVGDAPKVEPLQLAELAEGHVFMGQFNLAGVDKSRLELSRRTASLAP